MSGLAIVIPREGTGSPVNPVDSMLTDGSLLLIDPAHSANPWATGVPADGTTVPNIAWEQAAAVFGSGDETTLRPTFDISATYLASDSTKRGAAERTAKGGLHIATSVASSLANTDGAHFRLNSTFRTYLGANPTHRYFVSLWGRYSRADTKTSTPHPELISLGMATSPSNQIGIYRATQAWADPATTNLTSKRVTKDNATDGPFLLNCDPTGSGTPVADGRLSWGAGPTAYSTYNKSNYAAFNTFWPSWILYRWYVEDLTVSGRVYADVDALDFQAFAAATTGTGRYASDTYTAAATLCA